MVRPAAVCATSTGVQGATPEAGTAAVCCVVASDYAITSSSSVRIPFKGVPTFKNGPGGTMTVTKSYSGTASASVTAGASAEIGGVLAKAKVSVDATLATSNTTAATNSYTQTIAAGRYGNAQYVSYGKKVSYRKFRRNANCTTTTLGTGTISFPSSSEGWYYWQSTS